MHVSEMFLILSGGHFIFSTCNVTCAKRDFKFMLGNGTEEIFIEEIRKA